MVYIFVIFLNQISKKRKEKNVIKNIKNRNKRVGSLKNTVIFLGGCVSRLTFKAFFKPYLLAYILILILSLLLTSDIREREKQILKLQKIEIKTWILLQ